MNTADPAAGRATDLMGTIAPLLDERTLSLLERRRAGRLPQRRGWLVRRALALADLIGLTVAFGISAAFFAGSGASTR